MTAHAMLEGAYSVAAVATAPDGHEYESHSTPINGSVALLYFFDKSNPEILFKLLDGCGVNGHRWVFIAAVTDLAVQVTVTESHTGATRTYHSGPGPFQPVSDLQAFRCLMVE